MNITRPAGALSSLWKPRSLHRTLADQLWQADQTAVPIQPLTDQHPDLSIEDAYAIQSVNSTGGPKTASESAAARSD